MFRAYRVQRVWGLGFRVWGSRVLGLGIRVEDSIP